MLELTVSLMEIQTATDVLLQNADQSAAKACLIAKLIGVMFVDTPVYKMEVGNKEYTHAFIEIFKSLRL